MSVHADVTLSGRPNVRRAARTAALALAAVAAIGVLTGCGGDSSTNASAGTGSSSSAAGGSSKAPYSDAEACDWLKTSMPKSANPIMAEAGLAMDLTTFFEQHGGLEKADGYAYDDATARGCPDLREKALKQADLTSFGDI